MVAEPSPGAERRRVRPRSASRNVTTGDSPNANTDGSGGGTFGGQSADEAPNMSRRLGDGRPGPYGSAKGIDRMGRSIAPQGYGGRDADGFSQMDMMRMVFEMMHNRNVDRGSYGGHKKISKVELVWSTGEKEVINQDFEEGRHYQIERK